MDTNCYTVALVTLMQAIKNFSLQMLIKYSYLKETLIRVYSEFE